MSSRSSIAVRRRLCLEPLESRLCLSFDVGFDQGVLSIEGSREADSILIRDAGRGVTTVVDGDSGERWQFRGVTQIIVRAGEGDDTLRIADRHGDVKNLEVSTAGGNDSVWIDLAAPVGQKVREAAALIKLDLGEGNDSLDARSHGVEQLDLDIQAGGGDDSVLIGMLLPAVQKVREAAARARVDLGEGNNELNANAIGLDNMQLDITSGGGDDSVLIGMLLPAVQKVRDATARVDADLGDGQDRIRSTVVGYNRVELDITAGGGDDSVLIGMLLPAVQKVRESASRMNIDLGEGNNRLAIGAIGMQKVDLDVTAGGGDDNVFIGLLLPAVQKVRGSHARINVDLGRGANDFVLRTHGYETVETPGPDDSGGIGQD